MVNALARSATVLLVLAVLGCNGSGGGGSSSSTNASRTAPTTSGTSGGTNPGTTPVTSGTTAPISKLPPITTTPPTTTPPTTTPPTTTPPTTTPPVTIVVTVPGTPSRFAYVTSLTASTVTAYAIDPVRGTLTQIGAPSPVNAGPTQVVVDPSGKFLYVVSTTYGGIDLFTIDTTTGALTPNGTLVTGPVGTSHLSTLGIHPSGKYAYAVDSVFGEIFGFSIDALGRLTGLPGSPYKLAVATPSQVSFEPTGKLAFVPLGTGEIATLTVNATTGDLTLLSKAIAATGYTGASGPGSFNPTGVASLVRVEPTGRFAYSLTGIIGAPSQISVFDIDLAKGLVFQGLANIAQTGDSASSLEVHPGGKFLFNVDFGATHQAHTFSVSATTGTLTAGAVVPTGDPNATLPGPRGQGTQCIALDRSGRFAYATNLGNFTDSAVTVWSIDPATGALGFTATTMAPGATYIATAP